MSVCAQNSLYGQDLALYKYFILFTHHSYIVFSDGKYTKEEVVQRQRHCSLAAVLVKPSDTLWPLVTSVSSVCE